MHDGRGRERRANDPSAGPCVRDPHGRVSPAAIYTVDVLWPKDATGTRKNRENTTTTINTISSTSTTPPVSCRPFRSVPFRFVPFRFAAGPSRRGVGAPTYCVPISSDRIRFGPGRRGPLLTNDATARYAVVRAFGFFSLRFVFPFTTVFFF